MNIDKGLDVRDVLDYNCSVYALSSGSLAFENYYNGLWSQNYTDSFLPAYYLTNCTIESLKEIAQFANLHASNLTKWEYGLHYDTYEKTNNGDSFVALLFTISGTCVSCWMLSLLMYLSPKHKRKPWPTQLATVFYSILSTIILSHITDASTDQYYDDTMNLIELRNLVYLSLSYRVMVVFSQLFIQIAWMQLISHISNKFKWYSIIPYLIMMLTYTVIHAVYQASYNNSELVFSTTLSLPYRRWKLVLIIFRIILVSWLSASLLYYTTVIKNPRKICYSAKLLPLGVSSLLLITIHLVVNVLSLSLYLNDWQVTSWLILITYLLEIAMLTAIWEWIYGIEFLEKRYEIMGMLGRRISFNDLISFSLHGNGAVLKSKIRHYVDLLIRKIRRDDAIDLVSYSQSIHDQDISQSPTGAESHLLLDSNPLELEIDAVQNTNEDPNIVPTDDFDSNNRLVVTGQDDVGTHSIQSSGSYEDVYIDNYTFSDEEHQSRRSTHQDQPHSLNAHPPSFEPLPGFSHDDYWPDQK